MQNGNIVQSFSMVFVHIILLTIDSKGFMLKLIHDLMEIRFLLEPSIAALAAMHADDTEIKKICKLCDDVEELLKAHKDHSDKDIELHTAIALSSKNIVVPRLVPVIFRSIPLLIESICIWSITGSRYSPTVKV